MANAPFNIVYPIDGGTYPITNPPVGRLKSAYVTASFGVTCGGGPISISWGFDKQTIGKARAYDQFTAQFVWKLPGGKHKFWVRTVCGGVKKQDSVGFKVGT
jgi:hypothetical protein